MEYQQLGRTGLYVSKLCFGALTIGPLQANLPLRAGAKIIREALDAGVNFIDTAELYRTYPYIREALTGISNNVIIATKSYAYTYEDMSKSVRHACTELGRDYIDVFLMHEQVSRLTLKGHRDALQFLIDAKKDGLVKAIGVSTHAVEVVQAAALMPEIDVIHPILNVQGIGILDGTRDEMLAAINLAAECGKGIYTMKALGGGHLIKKSQEAFQWVLNQQGINAIAVGMQSSEEVALNIQIFGGLTPDTEIAEQLAQKQRRLLVEEWCEGCGKCVEKCPMHALRLEDKKVVQDVAKCVLCGYCGAHCPEFCLKII